MASGSHNGRSLTTSNAKAAARALAAVFCCRYLHADVASQQVFPYDSNRDDNVFSEDAPPKNVFQHQVPPQPCLEELQEVGVLADVEAADCGNSQCCSEDFEHTSALRSLHSVHAEASQPLQTNQDVTTDYGPWSVHQSGLDSVQLHTLLNQKEVLQHQVGSLQQQITWLQSHADLQETLNKDLLDEVMHLRDAYAAASSNSALQTSFPGLQPDTEADC